MNEDINLEILTNITNRTLNQTKFLLNLLDNNYEKLFTLERKLKNNFIFYCPSTKKEIKKILKIQKDKIDSYDWKTLDLVKSLSKYDNVVRHILSGRFGTIIREMEGNDNLSDQYGIYWLSTCDNVPIRKRDKIFITYDQLSMSYWTSINMVEFITNKHEFKLVNM